MSTQAHTSGPYHWRKYGQTEEEITRLRSVDLEPVRMLTNEGQIALMAGEGADRKRIALIDCQAHFKRGHGYKTECAERDANANLFAAADEMLAALKQIEGYLERHADEPECGEFYGIAVDAIAKAEGRAS